MRILARTVAAAIPVSLWLSGCSSGNAPKPVDPPGQPKVSSGDAASAASTARPTSEVASASGPLRFVAQEGWIEETPSNPMRKAQFRLPGASGDEEDAELVVTHFPGGAGSMELNIERWCSQFADVDGVPAKDRITHSQRRVGSLPVHQLELEGTYVAETFPGSGQRENKPNTTMLVAVIEADGGAYYAKLVGPNATVEAHRSKFMKFLSELVP